MTKNLTHLDILLCLFPKFLDLHSDLLGWDGGSLGEAKPINEDCELIERALSGSKVVASLPGKAPLSSAPVGWIQGIHALGRWIHKCSKAFVFFFVKLARK